MNLATEDKQNWLMSNCNPFDLSYDEHQRLYNLQFLVSGEVFSYSGGDLVEVIDPAYEAVKKLLELP